MDLGKLRAHKDKMVGKLTGGLAAMAKMRKVTVVRGVGESGRELAAPARRAWPCPARPARRRQA